MRRGLRRAGISRTALAHARPGQVELEDFDAVVGDAVARPRRVEAKRRAVPGRKGGASVVAKELVAEAADEAHGDRPGHGMRVLARTQTAVGTLTP